MPSSSPALALAAGIDDEEVVLEGVGVGQDVEGAFFLGLGLQTKPIASNRSIRSGLI